MGFHIIMPLIYKTDIMVFYYTRASSSHVPCNNDRWFRKWGCCSVGTKIFFSVWNPWTVKKSDFNFLLYVQDTNIKFTPIQSFPLYIRLGSHVWAKQFTYRVLIASGLSRWPIPQSQEFSIFPCHISKLPNFSHPK
jgi:hypothetical protein